MIFLRIHSLSQFMHGLLIRFTRWFNRTHARTGMVIVWLTEPTV